MIFSVLQGKPVKIGDLLEALSLMGTEEDEIFIHPDQSTLCRFSADQLVVFRPAKDVSKDRG